jgi:hypothetical protein
MKELVSAMKKAHKSTFLEVVTYTEDSCLAAAKLAIECQFDYLMGTVYFNSVHHLLKKYPLEYFPYIIFISQYLFFEIINRTHLTLNKFNMVICTKMTGETFSFY